MPAASDGLTGVVEGTGVAGSGERRLSPLLAAWPAYQRTSRIKTALRLASLGLESCRAQPALMLWAEALPPLVEQRADVQHPQSGEHGEGG